MQGSQIGDPAIQHLEMNIEKLIGNRRKSSLTQQTVKLSSQSNATQLENELLVNSREGTAGKDGTGPARRISSDVDASGAQPFRIMDMQTAAKDAALHQNYADLNLNSEFHKEAGGEASQGDYTASPVI